jgi:hypothetical protein
VKLWSGKRNALQRLNKNPPFRRVNGYRAWDGGYGWFALSRRFGWAIYSTPELKRTILQGAYWLTQ